MIGSYADWTPGGEQYLWLERDLAAFNRSRTPWLVAAFHSPWYGRTPHVTPGADSRALQ